MLLLCHSLSIRPARYFGATRAANHMPLKPQETPRTTVAQRTTPFPLPTNTTMSIAATAANTNVNANAGQDLRQRQAPRWRKKTRRRQPRPPTAGEKRSGWSWRRGWLRWPPPPSIGREGAWCSDACRHPTPSTRAAFAQRRRMSSPSSSRASRRTVP